MNYLKEELYCLVKSGDDIFDFIQECALDGLWYWDLEKPENEWMNPKFWTTLGYDPEKMPHKSSAWQSIIHPDDLKVVEHNFKKHCEDPEHPYDQVVRYTHKEGHTVWIRCRGMAVRDKNGRPIRMLGAHTDLTSQKEAELKLLERTGRYSHVIEGTHMGTWEWNVQTGETIFNERWADIIGYRLSDLEPVSIDTWIKFAHPEDLKRSDELLQAHFKGEKSYYECEVRMKHKDGHWVWVLDRGKVVSWTKDGKPEWMTGSHQEITERKKAEEAISESNRRNQLFVDQAPSAIAMVDTDMRYLAASQQWRQNYGLDAEDIVGKSHYDVFPEIISERKVIHQECLKGAVRGSDGELFTCGDGSQRWLAWEIRPWYQDKGKVGGLLMFTADITSLKSNEQLLLKYQDLLDKTNEAARIGTWEVDLNNMQVSWSRVTREIHEVDEGFQVSVETGISFYKEGENREAITSVFTGCIETGEKYDIELQIMTAKGREKWVRSIGIPIMENNKCIKVYGLFQDIDERKKAELEVKKLSLVASKTNNGVVITDAKGYTLWTNQGFTRLSGYEQAELYGKKPGEVLQGKETNPGHIERIKTGLESGKPFTQEILNYAKDGRPYWIELSITPVFDKAGNVAQFIAIQSDITDRIEAEKEIKSLLGVTQDQNKRLLNYAQIVSHNLRSHTGNLSMLLDIMKMKAPETTENKFFPLLYEACENLQETVGHLNEVVAINTATLENLEPLNLSQYVEKAIANVWAMALKVDCLILNDIRDDLEVKAIPAYLDSIILNLMTNAIKYRSQNKKPLIHLASEYRNDFVVLKIKDNGLGIDLKQYGSKLFGLYKTFHGNKDARGVGLFITKNQIEAMGGKVEVESEVEKGTTFKVFLNKA